MVRVEVTSTYLILRFQSFIMKRPILSLLSLTLLGPLFATMWGSLPLHAQDGTHDLTFSTVGYNQVPGLSNGSQFYDVVLQPDGKMVATGMYISGKTFPVIFRFNPDGSIDNTWSDDGYLIDSVGNRGLDGWAVARQSTGRILVAGPGQDCGTGTCAYVFAIAAYDVNGDPDSTWGGSSQVRLYPGGNASGILDIQVMPDDRVVVAGYFSGPSGWLLQVARLLPDGTPDPGFDGDGIAFLDAGANAEQVNSLLVQPDGSIVMAGYTKNTGDEDAIIAKLLPDGSPDLSFGGGDGFTSLTLTTSIERFEGLCRMQNGKYFAVGSSAPGAGSSAARLYARFTPDGLIDSTYSADGFDIAHLYSLPYSSTTAKFALALPHNKVVTGGWYLGDVIYDGYVERLDSNGLPDPTFADMGIDTLDIAGKYNLFYAMVQQPDGKLVCAGGSQIPFTFTTYYSLARYNMDDVITGTSETAPVAETLMICPNPVTGNEDDLNVLAYTRISQYQLVDISGKVIMQGNPSASGFVVPLQGIAAGTYLLTSTADDGTHHHRKLVISR